MSTSTPITRLKAICCIVASAFGFALMGMFVRLADFHGEAISAFQKGFFRNVVAAAIALAMFLRSDAPSARECYSHLSKRGRLVLRLRAAFGTIGIFANFYAISHIPLCDALMLNKMAPFFTVVFSWLFIGERISSRQCLCILGAIVGVGLVVRPGFAHLPLWPAAAGLLGGLSAGAAYACVRELGIMKADGRFIVLFFSTFSCLASLPFMAADFVPMTLTQVAILIGAGASAAIGQFGITAAYRLDEPRKIAVFDYTNVIFAALLGCLFLGQSAPDAITILGFAVIIAMALLINARR